MQVDYTFASFRVSVVYMVFGIFILSLSLYSHLNRYYKSTVMTSGSCNFHAMGNTWLHHQMIVQQSYGR